MRKRLEAAATLPYVFSKTLKEPANFELRLAVLNFYLFSTTFVLNLFLNFEIIDVNFVIMFVNCLISPALSACVNAFLLLLLQHRNMTKAKKRVVSV